ncbi:MAG: HEAT repeat domain-containing protein, partial [Nitrospinota bacterium]
VGVKEGTRGLILKALDSKSTITRMSALKAVTSLKAAGMAQNGLILKPVVECLNHEDADLRCDTARTLGKLMDGNAVEPLLNALQDPEADVRAEATQALGLIGNRKAVDALIGAMLADETDMIIEDDDDFDWDPQWDIQLHAVRALGRLKDPKAIEPLLKLLREEDIGDISETLLWAISQIPDEAAAKALIDLASDKNDVIRRRAVKVLGNVDHPDVARVLMELLLDENSAVRINAARSLADKKEPSALVPLALLLKDPDGEVKSEVAKIICEMGHPQTANQILPLLDDEDREAQGQSIEILGNLKEERAAEKMVEMLSDPSQPHKDKIAVALAKIGCLEAQTPLAEIARKTKEDEMNRIQAIYAIGEIAGDLALEVLKDCALDNNKIIYSAACMALQKIATPDAHSILISMLREDDKEEEAGAEKKIEDTAVDENENETDKNDDVQETVEQAEQKEDIELERKKFIIKTLGTINDKKSVETLYFVVKSGAPELRNEALTALSYLKEKDVVPFLTPILNSDERGDRLPALESLGRIGYADDDTIDKITEILVNDKESYIRQAAARALEHIGADKTVDALIKSLQDPQQDVRKAVVHALGCIKDSRALEPLFESLFNVEHFLHIRKDLALSLKNIDSGKSEDMLTGVLQDDDKITNHWIAIEALTELIKDTPVHAD